MADYNESELNTMRRDALRRMQEMQRRAMPRPASQPAPEQPKKPESGPGSLLGSLFGMGQGSTPGPGGLNIAGLNIDEEKAMIALLIYILYKQGADVKLLLALAYLLM